MKKCQECLQIKPKTEFWKQSRIKDGLYRMCKVCAREYDQRVRDVEATKQRKATAYQRHREKTLIEKKQYYKDNKAKLQAYKKKYYNLNYEMIAKRQKIYMETRKDEVKDYMRKYRQRKEYSVQVRVYTHSRRAKIKSSCDGTISKVFLETLLVKQNHLCYYCNTALNKGNTHLDHYIPISKGGAHSVGNVVFSCRTCNLEKSAKVPTLPLTFPI